jgi:hypothetical protein
MGALNVTAALRAAPNKITDRARLVLVVMALHSLDREFSRTRMPRLYYGGREMVCYTLGWFPSPAMIRRVDRAITELVEAGLIERLGTHAPGRAQCFRLNLPVDNPVHNPKGKPP